MKPTDLFCLGAFILAGLAYGIFCVVTKQASFRGRSYEGDGAVAVGWTIILISVLFAILIVCLEIT
jgi:hypothetical protein